MLPARPVSASHLRPVSATQVQEKRYLELGILRERRGRGDQETTHLLIS